MTKSRRFEDLKVGITGGTGFIGSSIYSLLSSKFKIKRLVRHSLSELTPIDIVGDLKNGDTRDHFLSDLDVVIHLANEYFPRSTTKNLSSEAIDNVSMTSGLFNAFSRLNPKGHIVYFSSGGAIYDPTLPRLPRIETDRLFSLSNYGNEKIQHEKELEIISTETGLSSTVLRVSNPYGVRLPVARAQGIIGIAISCLLENKEFTLFGSKNVVRDYIHLSDVAQATYLSIANPPSAGECRILNIGKNKGISTLDVIELIERVAQKKLKLVQVEGHFAEPDWNVLDISKAKKALNWEPIVSIEDGVSSMLSMGQ